MRDLNDTKSSVPFQLALLLVLGAGLGALLAAVWAPLLLPGLTASLLGPSPKAYWYLSRASGLVGYLLLWLSVVLGLGVTNRLAQLWPGGTTALDLHQFLSLLGLAFSVFHVLILLGDRYIGYSLLQLLAPFGSGDYRPLWVGLGQVGFYLALPVAFSFYVRRAIGIRAWRLLHYASFAVFLLVTAHGLGAGTDSPAVPITVLYGLTGLSTFFLTAYRALTAIPLPGRPPTGRTAPRVDPVPLRKPVVSDIRTD